MRPYRPPGWANDHHDDRDATAGAEDGLYWEPPRGAAPAPFVPRIGIVSRSDHDPSALLASLVHRCVLAGYAPLVITATMTHHSEGVHLRRTLAPVLEPSRVVAVGIRYTRTANRDDDALLIAVAAELLSRFPDADALLLAVRGAVRLAPELAHYTVAFHDLPPVGEHIARGNPDLYAPNIARWDSQDPDANTLPEMTMGIPEGTPIVPVNLDTGAGVDDLFALLRDEALGDRNP